MKRPFVWFVISFCLGIFAASRLSFSFMPAFLLAAVLLLFSFLLIQHGISGALLLCPAFLLGALLLKSSLILPADHILKLTSNKIALASLRGGKGNYFIKGVVDQCPILTDKRASFLFKTSQVQSGKQAYKCRGSIAVYLKGCQDVYYGEELIIRGALRQPYWSSEPVFCVGPADIIARPDKNKGTALRRFAFGLKNKAKDIIRRQLSPLSASIVQAMMLGERKQVPGFVSGLMKRSGTIHILVVSGFHVGIVFSLVILFLKLLRVPRGARFLLAIICLIIYCLSAGASLAVTRATIMAVTLIMARVLKREMDIYNSIALAAMIILAVNPRQLFNIGFQLSFASVISIVYLYPRVKAFLGIGFIKNSPLRFLVDGSIVSFCAWLGTSGIIAYYFRVFSPVAVPANMIIVPLAVFIVLSGFSMVFLSLTAPPLAVFFASTIELLALILFKINAFLLKIPYACLSL